MNKTEVVSYVAIAVIVVSLASIGLELTGRAVDYGYVNVNITSSAAIDFITEEVDFGSGYVWANATQAGGGATLYTNGTVHNGTFTGSSQGLVLSNVGNQNLNVTLKSNATAATFIGSNAEFQYLITNNTVGACQGQAQGVSYTEFSNSDVLVCGNLSTSSRVIDIDVRLYIPGTATPSLKNALITATAYAI